MTDKFQNKYRIPSARLQSWHYGWCGNYFITICSGSRESFFGEIINGEMKLSEIGILAHRFWIEIPQHFPFTQIDAFVIMPNHIHGILIINKPKGESPVVPNNIESNANVETRHCLVSNNTTAPNNTGPNADIETRQCLVSTNDTVPNNVQTRQCLVSTDTEIPIPGELRYRNPEKHSVSSIIGGYKSMVTKHARKIHPNFHWQARFHDHIIRDDAAYSRIVHYIDTNTENWVADCFYEKSNKI